MKQFKIYKPTLGEFLKESKGPIYLMITTKTSDYYCEIILNVTSFNDDDNVLHLPLSVGNTIRHDNEGIIKLTEKAINIQNDMKKKIEASEKKWIPGIISDELVITNIY